MEYLGNFISRPGVETDPHKILVVVQWPNPTCVKDLISFLDLVGYYKKFIKGYACISEPLTSLLKEGEFV